MRKILCWLLLCCSVPALAQDAPRPEIRGVWIHTYEAWDWDAIMPKIAAAGFNCVFVRVARGVNAIYPSQFLPRDGWAEKNAAIVPDELAKAIAAAHRNGLQFHAWKVNFNSNAGMVAGDGPKAFYGKMMLDDRLVRDPDAKQVASLNPGDVRNRDLEVDVMTEIATKYPVDGLHFDYIRYPEVPHYDFDYGPVSRVEFEKSIGRPVANWPRDVISGEDKIAYEDWERDNVNSVVQRVHDAVKKLRPDCQISAAVWRKHRKYRAAIKQDWIKWVNEGWLDFVCPMDYTKDMDDFRADVRSQVANTSGKVPLAAGIGSYMQATPDDVLKQIQIARDEGADGYMLFAYQREGMDALLEALTTGPQEKKVLTPMALTAATGSWEKQFSVLYSHGGLARKDDFPLVWAQRTDKVSVPPDLNASGRCVLTVERPNGEVLESVSVPAGLPPTTDADAPRVPFSRVEIHVPMGRHRLVVRGPIQQQGAKSRSYELRGPILEGVAVSVFNARRAKLFYRPADGGAYKAIYADGQAAKGIIPVLQHEGANGALVVDTPCPVNFDSLVANGISSPADRDAVLKSNLSFWAYFGFGSWPKQSDSVKILFLPQLNDVTDLSQPVINTLRKWVNDGGTLILTHDAVGWRWHPRLFPQVGQGNGLAKGQKIEILANDFGLTPGVYESNFPDHVTIEPGPDGVVLARDENGAPVMVGGKVGQGKVILCGQLLGYMPDGKLPPEEERLIQELAR